MSEGVNNPILNIREEDGTPSTFPYQLKVTNGTLTDNGDGTVSLSTGGGGSPGGSSGEVQFNNSGSFGADSNLFWNNTSKRLGIGIDVPLKDLHVNSSSDPTIRLQSTGSNDTILESYVPRTTENEGVFVLNAFWEETAGGVANQIGQIKIQTGPDTTNKDDGVIIFQTATGGSLSEAFRLSQDQTATFSGNIDVQGNNLTNIGVLELPNSATPTVDADGEIAVDTTVTDFSHGVLKYYGGEEMGVVAMPIAQFSSPSDGNVPAYNATTDEFEMVAPRGAAVNMQWFKATKSGTQTSTGTFADLTGWTQDQSSGDITFNTTTGVVTVDTTALYHVIVDVQGTNSTNRVQMEVKAQEDTGSGFVDNADLIWRNYSARNTTQHSGGFHVSYMREYTAGDDIKVLIRDIGATFDVITDEARIYIVKMQA